MISGTWFAAWGAWMFGPWEGVILGVLGGAVFGLLHALATVTFNVDHIVSGVAINILGLGAMRFLSSIVYTPRNRGLGHPVAPDRRSPQHRPTRPRRRSAVWLEQPGFLRMAGEPGAVLPFRRCRDTPRFHRRDQLAHSVGTRPGADHRLAVVEDALGSSSSVLWRGPMGGRVAWCSGAAHEVLRRDHLRHAVRSGRRLPCPGPGRDLPGGNDRRPGLHRSWCVDLRQLDAGWGPRWVPRLRLRRLPSLPWDRRW